MTQNKRKPWKTYRTALPLETCVERLHHKAGRYADVRIEVETEAASDDAYDYGLRMTLYRGEVPVTEVFGTLERDPQSGETVVWVPDDINKGPTAIAGFMAVRLFFTIFCVAVTVGILRVHPAQTRYLPLALGLLIFMAVAIEYLMRRSNVRGYEDALADLLDAVGYDPKREQTQQLHDE